MKKVKILALTTDKGYGGAERVFNTLNNALLKDFDVVECYFDKSETSYLDSKCVEYDLGVKGGGGTFRKIVSFLQRIYRFRQLIKRTEVDIVISHLQGADYVALLSGTKAKKICVIHGTKYGDKKIVGFQGMIQKKLMIPFIYALADKIVTVSEELITEICQHVNIDPQKVTCIYNSVDQDRINRGVLEPMDEKYAHIFAHKTLIASSRLDNAQKNLCGLIDVFKQFDKSDGVKLVIAGDGPDRGMLLDYAKEKELSIATVWNDTLEDHNADIYFVGYQSNPFPFISRADVFVLTSFYEGFPLGLIEAMACNTVLVASDCPTGPAEILQGQRIDNANQLESRAYAGALLPIPSKDNKRSIDLWCSAVEEFLKNDALCKTMVQNSRVRIEALSPSKINDEWEKLIKSIIKRKELSS